ncbi:unnamed protein product [Candidula unifasciata]|uniref:Suppressor of cytokine signaling 5 n=1 Tax=Candidula unifasciata TaxID=100452 RepID=A0A8S3Z1N4_9EUPU|nr:unnamed protein product [Candidula unifasciata]
MATASSSRDRTVDEAADTTKITTLGLFATSEMSSRPNTATANLYIPLLVSARASTTTHSPSPDPSLKDSSATTTSDDVSKTSTAVTKQIAKPTLDLRSHNSKGQRSSVRPFFCCGSELSLVSLVEGMDIKDNCSRGKNLEVSCNSVSAEDECVSYNSLSRKGSPSNAAHCSSESRHALVRRKLKEKHGAKKKSWGLHFRRRWNPRWRVSQPQHSSSHRFDRSSHITSGTYQRSGSPGLNQMSLRQRSLSSSSQFIDLSHLQDFDRLYPVSDVDTVRIKDRTEEMRAGIEIDSLSLSRSYRPLQQASNSVFDMLQHSSLGSFSSDSALPSPETPTHDFSGLINSVLLQWQGSRNSSSSNVGLSGSPRIHTQVDFIHCLVPDLVRILNCPFYWGVMDRYEAERLLDSKPEGTFLLRDSAQEDFLFSVSFRRYNRSLHARVEQWNHRFSFDAHDSTVFSAPTVCDLMEHYKDPCCCMFFEPMLTRPLPRNFPFSLQHICRAVICDHIVYDQIRSLPLPNSLKQFLQIYHYKQKVRVRRFDGPDVTFFILPGISFTADSFCIYKVRQLSNETDCIMAKTKIPSLKQSMESKEATLIYDLATFSHRSISRQQTSDHFVYLVRDALLCNQHRAKS